MAERCWFTFWAHDILKWVMGPNFHCMVVKVTVHWQLVHNITSTPSCGERVWFEGLEKVYQHESWGGGGAIFSYSGLWLVKRQNNDMLLCSQSCLGSVIPSLVNTTDFCFLRWTVKVTDLVKCIFSHNSRLTKPIKTKMSSFSLQLYVISKSNLVAMHVNAYMESDSWHFDSHLAQLRIDIRKKKNSEADQSQVIHFIIHPYVIKHQFAYMLL